MTDLYNDIFERWVAAMDETETIAGHMERVREIKYAPSVRYGLKEYNKSNFPAGGEVFDQNPDPESDYRRYGLDSNGLPVYVFFEHSWNKVIWEGVYNYSDSRAEYLEFCINTNLPSCVQVVKYENNRKISYQHFSLNGRGSGAPVSKDERDVFVEKLKQDEYSIISYIERYVYEGEKIIKAECFSVSPGIGQRLFEKRYTYNDQGELTEIRIFYPAGITQLEYVKVPDDLNVAGLINDLAEKMAGSIIAALLKRDYDDPIFLLELSYRRLNRYWPFLRLRFLYEKEELVRLSEEEGIEGLDLFEELFLTGSGQLINVDPEAVDVPLQQLLQLMEGKADHNWGTLLLRKTAALLTLNKLDGKLPVSDDFVAYAIDWEMEGQELEKILLECGQKQEIVQDWKAKGLLPENDQ